MEKEIKLVDRRCRKCEHHGFMAGGFGVWCDYIGDTGKPRPCPAGKECTEYKPGKRDEWRLTLQD